MSDSGNPDQMRARLRRIEGQIRGITKMLDENRSCEEVVTQLMAVRSGVDTVGALVLDVHLGSCISRASTAEQVDALRDSMRLWWRFAPGSGGLGLGEAPGAAEAIPLERE
jgi:DNA-binding FrmR family transcriptional regulator